MVKRIALLFFCILLLSVLTISAWNFPSTSTGTSAVTISTTTITGNLTNFTELWDTPDAYAGDEGDCVKVNAGGTGLEFDVCGAVSEVDPKWTGNYSSVITEPLWSANYTNLNSTWSSTYNATYDALNSTGLIKDWNAIGQIINWTSYFIDYNSTGLIQNYSLIIEGTSETDPKAYNGTLMYASDWNATNTSYALVTEPLWSANYTNLNSTWSSTYNATYDAYNSTGLIKDWNATFLIKDWLASLIGYNYWNSTFADFNKTYADTLYCQITEPLWSANYTNLNATWSSIRNDSYYLTSNPYGYYNSTNKHDIASHNWANDWMIIYSNGAGLVELPFNDASGKYLRSNGEAALTWETPTSTEPLWSANYTALNSTWSSVVNTSYGLATEPLWSANYTTLNATWSSVVNTSYALATEPLWSVNYTNLNATWSSIRNDSYRLFTNGTFTSDVNITTGNLSVTNRIKLAIGDCSGLVAGEICRNATAIYIQG